MQPLSQAYTTAEGNLFPGIAVYLLLLLGAVWLLPKAWRGEWPGHAVSAGAETTGMAPNSAAARRLRKGVCWLTGGLLAMHFGSILLAEWTARPLAAEWLLATARWVHPTLWVGLSATVGLALWRWTTPNAARPARAFMMVTYLSLITYLLAYGPIVQAGQLDLGNGPYWVLYQAFAPYEAMRSIARFGIYWMLFVAAYCGLVLQAGLAQLSSSGRSRLGRRRSAAVTVMMIAVVGVEYRVAPLPSLPVDAGANPVDHWLARQPEDTTVLHVPVMPLGAQGNQGVYLLGSTLHWRRMVNGYASFLPPEFVRLANTKDHSDFFQLLRAYYPLLDYVVVHGDKIPADESEKLQSRMLNDDLNVDLVTRLGDVLVFRPKLDWDRGVDILRRFPPADLDRMTMHVQARVRTAMADRSAMLDVRWGNRRTQREALTEEWADVAVMVPTVLETGNDDTVHVRFQSAYSLTPQAAARAVGTTGREIRADVFLDVQADETRLAINDTWEAIGSGGGWQLYTLTDSAGRLRRDWPSGPGVTSRELRRMVDALEPGVVVAIGASVPRARRLVADEIHALSAVGVAPPADQLRTLAVIGVAGAEPGSAPLETRGLRSTVRVGTSDPRPEIQLRRIRLEPEGPRSP